MSSERNIKLLAIAILSLVVLASTNDSLAQKKDDLDKKSVEMMERVMVIGSKDGVQEVTGSAHFIDSEVLEKNNYTDINKVLRQIPGVNLQEEEGYGNRPNIGLRGGRSERSADITLMEDGILIAPAPYSAPSAYYFPRVNRMEAVEVRKGSSSIKFGPRTTSGAINLISSSVPTEEQGELLLGYGSNNTQRSELNYGNSFDNIGFVFDLSREATDGFKSIDVVGGDTGYKIFDGMGKIRLTSDASRDIFQSLELKVGATKERSDETYLGLTDADFDADPYGRYAASQIDNMDAEHKQFHLRHYIDLEFLDATTTLYHNQFSRNWYKLDDITIGGVRRSLTSALNSSAYLSALQGNTDLDGSAANNLTVRANNRTYYSTGLQTDLKKEFATEDITHGLEFGARYHYDKEDRYQNEDLYSITGGVMTASSIGAPGSNANRHAKAKAISLYVLDEMKFGDWTVAPGARLEHVNTKRIDFNSGAVVENSVSEIIPGIGASYKINNEFAVLGGVHKGFAPPSPSSTNNDNEESVNYELGTRYSGAFTSEIIGFFNRYSNLLGECTLSSGCTGGATGQQFNAGEVDAYGLEFSAAYEAASALGLTTVSVPLNFNYTYTKAEFQNSFTSSFNEWGNVTSGDELPYISKHQFFVSAGVESELWEFSIAGKYVGQMRTQAGTGDIPVGQGTKDNFVADMAAEYEFIKDTRFFVNAENIFDKKYIASRRPSGARPGRPFTILAGVKYKL